MRLPSRLDGALAAVVTVGAQVETLATSAYEPRAAYSLAALVMCVPLAWRREAPLAVLALVFAPLVAMAAAGHPLDSGYVMAALILAFHAVGASCERRRSLIGLGAGLAGLAALVFIEHTVREADTGPAAGDFVFLAIILTAVWALAAALRDRAIEAGALEQRAYRLEREREARAREAVAEERARMARELHDVVAHSISVIAVQTGSIRRRLRRDRPVEAQQLAHLEQTAREALAEMRRLLGLLRAEEESLSLAPQPGMDQLDRLVDQLRRAGLPVEVSVVGEVRPLPPGVDLAAYRIVQEALTNTLNHAGRARARVGLRYGRRELELEIADDGVGGEAASGEANGGGHGLVGMRERAALYGGVLDIHTAAGRGFAVRARLPIEGR